VKIRQRVVRGALKQVQSASGIVCFSFGLVKRNIRISSAGVKNASGIVDLHTHQRCMPDQRMHTSFGHELADLFWSDVGGHPEFVSDGWATLAALDHFQESPPDV
jgi:hypothetical protein